MTDLPAEITYGKVIGKFLLAVPDSADASSNPDSAPAVGNVKFMPVAPNQRVLLPTPATVTTRPVSCALDASGILVDAQGAAGVWLTTGFYEVTFAIKNAHIAPLTIEVTAAHTALAPLDLALAIPPAGPPLTSGQYAELSNRITELGAPVIISATPPTDTTALWVNTA